MIILVGSENAGTGKSTLVTNLAVLFSRTENINKVFLVDVDARCISADWFDSRKEIKMPPSLISINCVTEYIDLSQKLEELNERGQRIIVDFPAGLSSEFQAALSVANFVIFPFRPLKGDLDTLPVVVEAVKKANNPKLVACAVITKYSDDAELEKTEIKKRFAKYADIITLIKPVINNKQVYKKLFNEGYGAVDLEECEADDPATTIAIYSAGKEIRALNSARIKVYNDKKNKKQTTATELSEIDEDNSQKHELESVPSIGKSFVSNTDFSAKEFADGLKGFTLDQLAEQYSTVHKQSQMMKGLILLAARELLPSNNDFGEWVQKDHALCVDAQQARTRYMNLAKFFKSRPMTGIPLTAAYDISAPINEDVAETVYNLVLDKNLKVKEIKKIIREEKSNLGQLPAPPKKLEITVDKEQVNEVLGFVNGFNLGVEEQVKLLKKCISELKTKENGVIDSEPSDE